LVLGFGKALCMCFYFYLYPFEQLQKIRINYKKPDSQNQLSLYYSQRKKLKRNFRYSGLGSSPDFIGSQKDFW
jgi:hypothetical protein